ncbi:MAG TPA: dihydrodipicolinate synthase family protein [Solirubrobacteraceae bacterium]|nr:dihydrodipicolinate synthase family protein [Solirubrobacteraceae bacterium]
MPAYAKREARDWAREHMRGCANVVIPSFTSDLRGLNEAGIRHDVRRCIELGFRGTLLVSEVNVTLDEYARFTEWAADEAAGRLQLVFHASFDTLEESVEAARRATAAGADYALLSYPANFYPQTEEDVFAYTKAFCDAVDLGVMLFVVPLWNFGRLHPADVSPRMLRRMVDEIPNVVAIKAEGARNTGGIIDVWRRLKDDVIVTTPLERDVIPLMAVCDFQYSGTSNTEYYGDSVPRMFELARAGEMDAAMEIYWRIQPARAANQQVGQVTRSTGFINRMQWKFQGWLQGMNGGPLRRPTMKVDDRAMATLRRGLVDSGFAPESLPNGAFFEGRNPA